MCICISLYIKKKLLITVVIRWLQLHPPCGKMLGTVDKLSNFLGVRNHLFLAVIYEYVLYVIHEKKIWSQGCNFIKNETSTQMFSCEFSEIFKNIFFHRTPPMGASED